MAEGSGTLFAKVAAMRDFGLLEGRGELRISPLAQRVLHPANDEEGQEARAEAFQRVDLLRQLYARFEGEVPDDMSMLVGLEEITRSPRDEIVRRAPLIQKHLTDAIRVLGRPVPLELKQEQSGRTQNNQVSTESPVVHPTIGPAYGGGIEISAAGRHLSVPLTAEYISVAIRLLDALKGELADPEVDSEADEPVQEPVATRRGRIAELELGTIDQLEPSEETTD